MTAEHRRLEDARTRTTHWKRWGPYVSDRGWGTVREDYSADGEAWDYLPHDQARSRAYRWNEDGLAAICDRHQEICLGLALWNGRDPILKERLFGLTGNEGNHGEDVKEYYFHLDSTPTHSFMRMLYKYPQAAVPVQRPGRRESAPRPHGPRVRADRHRRLRRRSLLRRVRRVRQDRLRRSADEDHGGQPRARGGGDPRAADDLVPQHLGVGRAQPARTPGGAPTRPGQRHHRRRDDALRPALALRRGRAGAALHGQRDQCDAPVRDRRSALRQGWHRRGGRARTRRRREPGPHRHQGGRRLRADRARRRERQRPPALLAAWSRGLRRGVAVRRVRRHDGGARRAKPTSSTPPSSRPTSPRTPGRSCARAWPACCGRSSTTTTS